MKPIRILVTGSRFIDDAGRVLVWNVMTRALSEAPGRDAVFIEGGANGADQAARYWVETYRSAGHMDVSSESHAADWAADGRYAGPKRNAAMVKLGADLCLAFPRKGSKGTWGCLRLAADAGIPVRIYPLQTLPRCAERSRRSGNSKIAIPDARTAMAMAIYLGQRAYRCELPAPAIGPHWHMSTRSRWV